MSDDKSKTVADRKRINVQEQELCYWSHRLGVSSDELKRAVSKVGVMADDVARVLGKSWLHFAGGSRGKVGNLAGTKRGAVRGSKSERIGLCREWEPFALGNGGWLQVAVGRLCARPLRIFSLGT